MHLKIMCNVLTDLIPSELESTMCLLLGISSLMDINGVDRCIGAFVYAWRGIHID